MNFAKDLPVKESAKILLQEIGRQLDRGIFPVVKNSGIVSPSYTTVYLNPLGKESKHEAKGQRLSTTQPRPEAIGREEAPIRAWASARAWSTSGTTPVLSANDATFYREPLSSVCEAYPGTRLWEQAGGFWLYTESVLLPELGRKVGFLIGISIEKRVVKSWAFYTSIVGASWIGPRHTNFPDGSICAFEPRDSTWVFGDSLVELLDLYSVWALRHLHFEVFGRWPGPQAVAMPYERLLELADDEHCGCGSSDKRYIDCCREADLQRNRLDEAMKFGYFSCWTIRHPPASVVNFMLYRDQPPKISELI